MNQQKYIDTDDLTAVPASALYFLRTFRTVAALRSYTRAAQALNLGQPAVSAQIRALERHYGARLFQVRQRRVYLTAAGEALLAYADRAFNLLRDAPMAVKAAQLGSWGRLTLGASGTIGIYLLPRVLRSFISMHHAVDVEVSIGTSAEIVAQVIAERVPLGLVEAPVNHPTLDVHPVGQDELVLVAPPAHRLADARAVAPDDLRTVPLLRREAGSGTQAVIDAALWQVGVVMPTAMVLGSTEALKQAALAGIAAAWLPRSTVARELATGELKLVPVEGMRIERTLSMIALRGLALPAVSTALLELLEQSLAVTSAER
jgi:DNA-binding transcriptional LysR family regulator